MQIRAKGWCENNSWTSHYKHHTRIPWLWLCVKHVSYLMWKAECFLVNLLLCSSLGVHIALKMYWPFQDYFWECLKNTEPETESFLLRHKQIHEILSTLLWESQFNKLVWHLFTDAKCLHFYSQASGQVQGCTSVTAGNCGAQLSPKINSISKTYAVLLQG